MKLRESENIWVLGIFLGIVGLISALILAIMADLTAKPVNEAKKRNRTIMYKQLDLPNFNQISSQELKIKSRFGTEISFLATGNSGKISGFIAQATTNKGYSGTLELMLGLLPDGRISAVQIISHKETPGLGANVCERKFLRTIFNLCEPLPSGLPPNPILDQFRNRKGLRSGAWKVKKDGGDIDFKTGATVTSRAITDLVSEIATVFVLNYSEINKNLSMDKK